MMKFVMMMMKFVMMMMKILCSELIFGLKFSITLIVILSTNL